MRLLEAFGKNTNIPKEEKDEYIQEYFGVNCFVSKMFVDGIKTSTFEKIHSLPAYWIQLAGNTIEIETASTWGAKVADFVVPQLFCFKLNPTGCHDCMSGGGGEEMFYKIRITTRSELHFK